MNINSLLNLLNDFSPAEMRALLKGLIEVRNADGIIHKNEESLINIFIHAYRGLAINRISELSRNGDVARIKTFIEEINSPIRDLDYENPATLKKIMSTDINSTVSDPGKREVLIAWLVTISTIDNEVAREELEYIVSYMKKWGIDFREIYSRYLENIVERELAEAFY